MNDPNSEPDDAKSPPDDPKSPPDDPNADRRKVAWWMFVYLLAAVLALAGTLVVAAGVLDSRNPQLQGIIMTALAGAMSSLLTFIGLIVKGLVDNLTRSGR